jgi:ribosome-associated protein
VKRTTTKKPLAGKKLVDTIIATAEEKLADHITVLDLRKVSGASSDWFVLCQSDNTTHNSAIGREIDDICREKGTHAWHVEGETDGRWVLLDISDVVVHIMLPDVRKYYNLEGIWPDAVRKDLPSQQKHSDD